MRFHIDREIILANAAPFIPYSGIKKKFNNMFTIAPKDNTIINITCLPVICKKLPTEPERELISFPNDKNTNAFIPPSANSAPNKPNKKLGKRKKTNTIGSVVKNIILED